MAQQWQKPVVALDIDGTLGKYHEHFTAFAEQWSGRSMPSLASMSPDCPFYRHLGMSKTTYRQCKLAYRQGGMKRSMPVFPGAVEMIRGFRRTGAEVWICTTRPYLRLDNIDPDTRHWLRRNGIQYDGILYGTYKYKDLILNVGKDRVIAVLDDLPEQCTAASALGLDVYIHDRPYNKSTEGYIRILDFENDPWRIDVRYMIRNYIRRVKYGS